MNYLKNSHKLVKLCVFLTPIIGLLLPLYTVAVELNGHPADSSSQQLAPTTRLWNLQNVDIKNVIEQVSLETGKNFLVDPRVNGKVTMIASKPMDANEIYQVFLSMLQVLGYGAVPTGDVIKIVPLTDARYLSPPSSQGRKSSKGDELLLKVISVKNVSASKLVPILRPLLPDSGNIAAYDAANTLIISGTADSIQRISSIIRDVDKANTAGVEMVPLRKAAAAKVVTVLTTLMANSTDPSSKVTLAADEHTNSVLMSGDQQARLRTRALISQMDSPPPASSMGNTQVVHLQYQRAKDLAPILAKIVQNIPDAPGAAEGGAAAAPTGNLSVQAEPTTNSIIITAPPTVMASIKSVVERLDRMPAQVLVEAAIVEVDDLALSQIGIEWGVLSNEGRINSGNADAVSIRGLPLGFNPGIGVIKNGNLRGIVHLLATDDSANILSTPSVMVMDNQKAEIEVGQSLSIETGSYANTDGSTSSVTPFNTFAREDIGLHLFVTPQINRGNAVQLEIDQGNETLEDPVNPSTTPVTNKTTLKTTVLVNSGDVLVLGGLISNNITRGQLKIPFLGDIPVIGQIFQYNTQRMEKKNLMIFLKPIIIRKPTDAEPITEQKYTASRSEELNWLDQERYSDVNYDKLRTLPPWKKGQPNLPLPFTDQLIPYEQLVDPN